MKSAGSNKQPAEAALLEFILEAAGEGIVFVQSEKTIGYINQAGREILHCALYALCFILLTAVSCLANG